MTTKNSPRNQKLKIFFVVLPRNLPHLLAAGFLLVALSACASDGYRVYSRSFEQSPDVLWTGLLKRLESSGDKIKKIKTDEKKVILEKSLKSDELYLYAQEVPSTVVGGGEAEIELWVAPAGSGGASLNSQAVLYVSSYEYGSNIPYNLRRDRYGYSQTDVLNDLNRRDLVPATLESNGILEMKYLGYSEEEAKKMLATDKIQAELAKAKKA